MATGSRRLNLGDARFTTARPRSIRPAGSDLNATIAAAGLELANDLLGRSAVSLDVAEQALERLRVGARAIEVTFWMVTDARASCLLRVGDHSLGQPLPAITLANRAVISERLRRRGVLLCRDGEVTGLEDLVAAASRSYAVLSCVSDADVIGVLVLGWDLAEPPCDETAISHLQIATGAMLRTLPPMSGGDQSLADAVFRSISDGIAVIDRDGIIVAVNAAWSHATLDASQPGPGSNCCDWYIRASGHSPDARTLAEGIRSVARDGVPLFQMPYVTQSSGKEVWALVTATPLRHPGGGAVITHARMLDGGNAPGDRLGERWFEGLVDALPAPVWIHGGDGRIVHGNAAWKKAARAAAGVDGTPVMWTDLFHPDDRAHAESVFRDAFTRQEPFALEVRFRTAAGAFAWAAISGAPYLSEDHHVRGYVGSACDISAQRRAERALSEMGTRLVAAQEEERSRIARELHDDLGQQTAMLATRIEMLLRSSKASASQLRDGIAETQQGVQDLAVSIHALSHELHPPKLKLLGLIRTLESLCANVSKNSPLKVTFRATRVPPLVQEHISLCICRVAQEALQNAVKHSGARHISVTLACTEIELVLRVSDSGSGFDPLVASSGIGLITMRERVELNGGRLLVDASPTGGTTIEATLPNVI